MISGAIGGGIAAALGCFNMIAIKDQKETWKKVLISVAFFAVTVLICHFLGKALIDTLNSIAVLQ